MGNMVDQFQPAMAIFCLLILFTLDFTVAQTGVCYGRDGNNLPSPGDVVALYNQNNIRRMRIYNPDQPTLQALRGSNIEVILGVPNTDLENVAASQANANTWVQNNIRNYPNVRFRYIAVGNEVSPLRDTSRYVRFVLPALQNIQIAISNAGLGNQIKVSTAIETGVLGNSYPPADGVFRSDVTSYLNPIIRFLANNGAPLLVNVYPYFSYIGNKGSIDIQYALFQSDGITVPGGIRYQNLFYALVDATYAALEKSGGSSLEIVVSESGWPSAGGDSATLDNERIYITNLIQRVKTGTPKRPNRPIETYIFAMFDENQKGGAESEKHFGIFSPNRQPKFQFSFN
ncbi:Glucan endo-1,3-beta-D-glucosidase [Handroanthus impetiginosus]|uniref:Glucan endo-1,3-beta-D-glucosidase n=1 Tax=Handroanthus impetiginosus TaxID=429701 RepID=A0A2G9GBQ1_9LAMI|nr:Glucan endo-1,3-beta-D-glucosidase [Handroanthus impetiginosus]